MIKRFLERLGRQREASGHGEELDAILTELEALWAREVSPERVAERKETLFDVPGLDDDAARLAFARSVLESARVRVGPPPSDRDLRATDLLGAIRAPSFRAGTAHRLRFSRDGRMVATLSNRLALFDVASRSKIGAARTPPNAMHLDFDVRAGRIAIKSTAGRIVTLRVPELEVEGELANDQGEGAPVLFDAEGAHLIDGSWQGDLTVREVESGRTAKHRSFPDAMLRDLVTTPERHRFAAVLGHKRGHPRPCAGRLLSWRGSDLDDLVCDTEIPTDAVGREIQAIALRADGGAIAVATYHHVAVFDVASARLVRGRTLGPEDVPGERLKVEIDWSPCGSELALAGERGMLLLDAESLEERFRVPMAPWTHDVRYAPSGDFVAAAARKSLVLHRDQLARAASGPG